ncbi:hypothetical protein M8J76_011486 [Diaphorina citri]|nr:hypothetical protein M8J75_015903 [Diaphorina citri]KAI5737245.1 hypothetical protein M8J76_011486 [Diaphorina citri]
MFIKIGRTIQQLVDYQDNITYGHIYGHHKEWNDVILPAAPSEAYNQQMSYLIRGLDPGAQYEAQVQAKNRFGWNKMSDKFQFTTRGVEDIRDMSITAANTGTSPCTPVCLFSCFILSLLCFIS